LSLFAAGVCVACAQLFCARPHFASLLLANSSNTSIENPQTFAACHVHQASAIRTSFRANGSLTLGDLFGLTYSHESRVL
jgi:hypothetical protein